MKCRICGKEFESYSGLGNHISKKHKIASKEYYDTYIKSNSDGLCFQCGIPTTYKNLNIGYLKYCYKCSKNNPENKQKRKETNLRKYGVEQVLSSKEIRAKVRQTMLDRYGSKEIFSTQHFKDTHTKNSLEKYNTLHPSQNRDVQRKARKKYVYNEVKFHSSWELAVYVWHEDHNIPIEREPITIKFITSNGNTRHYLPDFRINDKLIEIKGNQYLDEDGKLLDLDKQKCIESNNVIIWSYDDIKEYLEYCEDKFNDRYWAHQFKVNNKRTKVGTAKIKNNPITCMICNKTFQNGNYLSAHLRFEEQITAQDYYNQYIKHFNEGICPTCGKPTKYINFTRGYQIYCSRQCSNNLFTGKGLKISKTKISLRDTKRK